MTREQAVDWCIRNGIDISFRPVSGQPRVRLQWGAREIEAEELSQAVERMQENRSTANGGSATGVESIGVESTPIDALNFGDGLCGGRIQRLAGALRIETIGELLSWANEQPDGLGSITRYRNIGDRSLRTLTDALRQKGIREVPG